MLQAKCSLRVFYGRLLDIARSLVTQHYDLKEVTGTEAGRAEIEQENPEEVDRLWDRYEFLRDVSLTLIHPPADSYDHWQSCGHGRCGRFRHPILTDFVRLAWFQEKNTLPAVLMKKQANCEINVQTTALLATLVR